MTEMVAPVASLLPSSLPPLQAGKGSYGIVAEAVDLLTGETVAIKKVRASLECGDQGAPYSEALPAAQPEETSLTTPLPLPSSFPECRLTWP